jgi:hypothetical protein
MGLQESEAPRRRDSPRAMGWFSWRLLGLCPLQGIVCSHTFNGLGWDGPPLRGFAAGSASGQFVDENQADRFTQKNVKNAG